MSDLIDRQKAIRNICNEDCHQPTPCKWKCIAIEELEALPSVQPRKGKWIRREDRMLPIICECSVCGFDTTNYELFYFCPNCGCHMEEGDSE